MQRDVSRKKRRGWSREGTPVRLKQKLVPVDQTLVYPMIGLFWQLLSAPRGSLRCLEMWWASNEITDQVIFKVWWSVLEYHPEEQKKLFWFMITTTVSSASKLYYLLAFKWALSFHLSRNIECTHEPCYMSLFSLPIQLFHFGFVRCDDRRFALAAM